MAEDLKLLYGVLGKILKEQCKGIVREATQSIDAGEDAVVDYYTTDRYAGSISVPAYQQAKDGKLTKGVSRAGLEFKAK